MRNSTATQTQPGSSRQPLGIFGIWWTLLAFLLIWNISGFFFRPSEPTVVTLPYSVFIDQVQHDNVSVVRIVGSKIAGTFLHPVRWPPAQRSQSPNSDLTAVTPAADNHASSAAAANTPSKSTGGSGQELRKPPAGWPFGTDSHGKPADYEAFLTTFPETVGDPRLLPLLEAHGVQDWAW